MVVYELKIPYEEFPFFIYFNVNVKKIKIEIHQKFDYDMDLWKYGSF